MNIYISNLSSLIGNDGLRQLFSTYGKVTSAEVKKDIITGESRGFGFIEMEDHVAATNAILGLHQTEVDALTLSVQEEVC